MIGSAMDMMAQISVNTASSTSTSSSTSGESNSSGEFEKLMEKHQSESSSDTSTNKSENSEDGNVSQGTEGNAAPGEEVTDIQMEMMAALSMSAMNFRTVDVVLDSEEVELDLDLMVTVEDEVVEVLEVSLEEEMFVDLPEFVLESSDVEVSTTGKFEEAEIVLDEDSLLVDTVVTVEMEVEIPAEMEVVQSGEAEVEIEVEAEMDVSVEEAPEVDVEQKVTSKVSEEEQEEVSTDDTVIVQENQQGTVVFEKAEGTPVKVAETVNTRDPDMDTQIAKIIQNADADGEKSVTIRLNPEGMGTITAQITHTADGNLQIILQTTDDAATILLKNHVNQLAMALQSNNQTVTVEVHNTEEGQSAQQDLEEQNEQENQKQGEQENQEDQIFEYSEDFMQQLRLGLVKEFSLEISE